MKQDISYYYYLFETEISSDCGGSSTIHKVYLIRFVDNYDGDSYRFVVGKYNNCNEYIDSITMLTKDKAIEVMKQNKIKRVKKEIDFYTEDDKE